MDKTKIFQKCLKLFLQITPSSLGRMSYSGHCPVSTTDLYKGTWHFCSWHLHKRGSGACICLQWCLAFSHSEKEYVAQRHFRHTRDWNETPISRLLPWLLQAFRTNRPHLQTCTCCKSVCKHCSSHYSTPCQKVKLLFKAQCWKTCWLPESLTLETKFSDTFPTGTSHMRCENPNLLP